MGLISPGFITSITRRNGMTEQTKIQCPECDGADGVGRRDFLKTVGGTAVTLAGLEIVPQLVTAQPAAQPNQPQRKPAENLIRELYEGLNAEQRRRVVYAFDHGAGQNQTA